MRRCKFQPPDRVDVRLGQSGGGTVAFRIPGEDSSLGGSYQGSRGNKSHYLPDPPKWGGRECDGSPLLGKSIWWTSPW